jgi:hypothetical protein
MTSLQQDFYKFIRQQIIEFNEDFQEEITISRIERIPDDHLQNLLDEIYSDKDNISTKKYKGYVTYQKFIYYTDKLLESTLQLKTNSTIKKVEELNNKRQWLLQGIENQTNSLEDRNKLIKGLQNKTLMFNKDGKNILDECDYFIIEHFGYFNFFDENKNYHIKEEIEKYYKEYLLQKQQLTYKDKKLLN